MPMFSLAGDRKSAGEGGKLADFETFLDINGDEPCAIQTND
jgi:hypothetical protein